MDANVSNARGTGDAHKAQLIYRQLADELRNGMHSPGDRFTLRALAKEYNASMTPVRDAINRLVGEMALDIQPNRSIVVHIPRVDEVREVRQIRMELEGLAASIASNRLTEEDVSLLVDYQSKYEQARKEKDISTLLKSNSDFHFTIYNASRKPILIQLIESFWMRNGPVQLEMLSQNIDKSEKSDQIHQSIIQAARQRDGDMLKKLIRYDIECFTDDIVMSLAHYYERKI